LGLFALYQNRKHLESRNHIAMSYIAMSRSQMIYLGLTVVVAILAYTGWKLTARGAYESADYTVETVDGAFEIREYPPLMMATTEMQFEAQGEDGSFMRLFRYISGANDGDQKVAMTTPVFMQPDIDQMGFVIPSEVAARHIPSPSGDRVEIRERRGGRFAVIRFNGRLNAETFSASEQRLRSWMASRELQGRKDAESAGYDPPWTPGPLRRNEVLIRLQ